MRIEIKRLTPELTEDYLRFFDVTPHSTGIPEHRCYCVCWASAYGDAEECATAEMRRALAGRYVRDHSIQGYLAYRGSDVIGWCNANTKADCYDCISWRMFMSGIERDARKVKSVFCFAIAPAYRGKGIAAALLERVLKDAGADGFDCVEAYPNAEFIDAEQDFMGPARLYEKAGFTLCYEANGKLVMRKDLG